MTRTLALLLLVGLPLSAARADTARSPAERELYALGAILSGARAQTKRAQRPLLQAEVNGVVHRLAMFEVRFGRRPNRSRGWRTLQRAARSVLKQLAAPSPPRRLCRPPEERALRGALLELAGRRREGLHEIDAAIDLETGG